MKNKPIKLWILLTALFFYITANANLFKYEGLYYNILSETDMTVETHYYPSHFYYMFGNITIPQKIIYNNTTYTVTSIGESTFANCSNLTSISIPNSVTSIGDNAFSECSGLTSVSIPNSVTSIGNSAFSGCSGLTSVSIPNSVTLIEPATFQNCNGLISIYIPNSVTSIGYWAFLSCSGLTSVTIGYSVTSIGNSAFSGCIKIIEIVVDENNPKYCSINGILYSKDKTNLIKFPEGYKTSFFEIPNSVTSISGDAFRDCNDLTSVYIPNSVTSIGSDAFWGCNGLTSVTIPNSVTFIGTAAFMDCKNLQNIYCRSTNPLEFNYGFSNENYTNATLYIPIGTRSAYEKVDPWRNFWNIEEYDFSGVDDITIDDYSDCPVEIYNLSGNKVGSSKESLSPGIYIMRQGCKVEKIMIQ